MKVIFLLVGVAGCVAASADTSADALSTPHSQPLACSLGGCIVSCPTTGRVPAIQFRATELKLTLLPSRVAVFDATSGYENRKTYLVDLSERNCEISH